MHEETCAQIACEHASTHVCQVCRSSEMGVYGFSPVCRLSRMLSTNAYGLEQSCASVSQHACSCKKCPAPAGERHKGYELIVSGVFLYGVIWRSMRPIGGERGGRTEPLTTQCCDEVLHVMATGGDGPAEEPGCHEQQACTARPPHRKTVTVPTRISRIAQLTASHSCVRVCVRACTWESDESGPKGKGREAYWHGGSDL